jgi:hypothetical protein
MKTEWEVPESGMNKPAIKRKPNKINNNNNNHRHPSNRKPVFSDQ